MNDNCVINVITPETASDDRTAASHRPGRRFTKGTVNTASHKKNYELQRLTKKLRRRTASHTKKFRCNLRLTKGIYLNWRLTKEIAVRSVSQKAFI